MVWITLEMAPLISLLQPSLVLQRTDPPRQLLAQRCIVHTEPFSRMLQVKHVPRRSQTSLIQPSWGYFGSVGPQPTFWENGSTVYRVWPTVEWSCAVDFMPTLCFCFWLEQRPNFHERDSMGKWSPWPSRSPNSKNIESLRPGENKSASRIVRPHVTLPRHHSLKRKITRSLI